MYASFTFSLSFIELKWKFWLMSSRTTRWLVRRFWSNQLARTLAITHGQVPAHPRCLCKYSGDAFNRIGESRTEQAFVRQRESTFLVSEVSQCFVSVAESNIYTFDLFFFSSWLFWQLEESMWIVCTYMRRLSSSLSVLINPSLSWGAAAPCVWVDAFLHSV